MILTKDDWGWISVTSARPRICTKNLRILPTFLVDGFAAGLWKIERTGQGATLVVQPFGRLGKAAREELGVEGEALLRFVEREAASVKVRFAKS